MKIYKTSSGIIFERDGKFYSQFNEDWDAFINDDNLYEKLVTITQNNPDEPQLKELLEKTMQAPIQGQEVWGCGVTYFRSKVGRQEEAKDAGGGDFYERVYNAERPEVFFKATANRTVGHGEEVRIRKDSTWDVPEPEVTLFVTSSGKIVGYTIGNDMSSRSIEGENPLYLPQAKTYDSSAAIGPSILVSGSPLPVDSKIELEILRNGKQVFYDSVEFNQMKRKPEELVSFLFRECTFQHGCFIMTGTGIVPSSDFTLKTGDEIRISVENIGTLVNKVK